MVARMVQQRGGDVMAARDIFHDALIVYLEKQRAGTLYIRVSPTAYLTGIARLLWLRKQKAAQVQELHADLDLQDVLPGESDALWNTLPLEQYLQATGEKCLQLLEAFYYRQMSMPEIAQQMQYKTTHSATVQKYKCIEKLRNQVKAAVYEKCPA